jgi:hypothetical protein
MPAAAKIIAALTAKRIFIIYPLDHAGCGAHLSVFQDDRQGRSLRPFLAKTWAINAYFPQKP